MINNTRIRLYGTVDGYLDTDKDTQVPLTFSISDIKDISKRKGTFSKSIVLPGTKNNNILLNNYFDVNIVSGTFNINKIVNCAIIQDGITILDNAIMQLVSVNISQPSVPQGRIEYTVLIKDTASDLFTNINNKYLSDLDFSNLNHIYNAQNVISSFNNTISDGYKYVMPFNSPNLDQFGADAVFDLIEFSPGIYAKQYFDKIFTGAGYTYNWSDALTKYRFDKLIIPYNGDVVKVEKEESSIYTASAGRTASVTFNAVRNSQRMYAFGGNTNLSIDYKIGIGNTTNWTTIVNNIEVTDPNNNYNPTTGIYTSPDLPSNQNNVKVEYTIEYDIVVNNPNAFTIHHVGFFNPSYPYAPSGNYTRLSSVYRREVKPLIRLMSNTEPKFANIINNGTPFYINQGQSFAPSSTTILKSGTMSVTNTIEGIVPNSQIYLNTGFNFIESVTNGIPNYDATATARYNFYNTAFPTLSPGLFGSTTPLFNVNIQFVVKKMNIRFVSLLDGAVSYNIPLKMNKFIPAKIKQSDFIKGILTMFNLYVEVDKTNPTIINIIGRDDYYDSGKIEDWTEKLVKDEPQEIKFIPEITNKKLLLTYKADKDWANERYTQATNEIYGQVEYTFDNEFVKDVSKTELLFSPTPVANTEFGAICPIWNGQAPKTNIRILYDGGEYTCGNYNIVNYRDPQGVTGSFVTASTFPLITHWDKPYNPTFDLNFLPPDYYYRSDNWGSNTNNNLFNSFWRRTINQINNGKILTAYFELNSYDIQKLRLNDKIRIDNSWWVINSVKDYDANSTKPTKVELVSVDDSIEIPFVERQTFTITAGSPVLQVLNDLEASKTRYKNTIITTGQIDVVGRDNYVGAGVNGRVIGNNNNVYSQTTLVYGDNNSTNDTRTIILGDNNSVENDVENAMVVGDNIVATQSNTLYASNIVVTDGGTINNQPINNIVGLWEEGTGANSIQQLGAQANGDYSFAVGTSQTNGDYSVSMGNGSDAQGLSSVALGFDTVASGNYSFAMGDSSQAIGDNSISMGDSNLSSGVGSVAFGGGNSAIGNNSISLGVGNNSVGDYSFTSGHLNEANSLSEAVVGQYAELVTGNATTFVSTDTAFRVGIGTGTGTRLDGFRVYKNGAIKLNPVTSASITTPTLGMMIFDSVSNDIKIYNGTGWVTIGSTNMEKKLVIRITGTTTFNVVRDDLGIAGVVSIVVGTSPAPALDPTITVTFSSLRNSNNTYVSNMEYIYYDARWLSSNVCTLRNFDQNGYTAINGVIEFTLV